MKANLVGIGLVEVEIVAKEEHGTEIKVLEGVYINKHFFISNDSENEYILDAEVKREAKNIDIKKQLKQLLKYSDSNEIQVNIVTTEADDRKYNNQYLEVRINDEYSGTIFVTNSIEVPPYTISKDLQKEAKALIKYLEKNFNEEIIYSESDSF